VGLVVVAGSDLAAAAQAFEETGYAIFSGLPAGLPDAMADVAVIRYSGVAEMLRNADSRKLRYTLIHIGSDDGEPGGSYERAHHRVQAADLPELAQRLKSRRKLHITCLAFGYKQGIPEQADWVVDTRFLVNPYWELELRPLSGMDAHVRDFVLGQPAAGVLLDNLEQALKPLLPLYREQGKQELTIAFGCTGGRHRSVVLAAELAKRLGGLDEIDVELDCRDAQV
jgi:RNase adaptor protein for sRNA GlmZ degradation